MKIEQAKIKAEILKALAHPVRIILVDALSRGDMCVCDMNTLVNVDQSNVSRHLAVLKKAGIVSERRDGMRVIHHLETPCILNAVGCAENVLMERLARQAKLMKKD
ncbi:MAG TPA: metalloregulator ArsR/SmtB family transcription factor [Desulfomonilia bacterium]